MKIVYETIKEEYPEAMVIGLAPTMTDIQWIRDVFSLGAGKYMDAATMHPYAAQKTLEASGFIKRMQEIRQIADENGCEDLPIWITENGWYKYTCTESTSFEKAKEYLKEIQNIFKDAVIIAFEGDKKITLKEALDKVGK